MNLAKRPSAWVPIVVPLLFLAYMLIYISAFGVVREEDEGTPAHLFQIWLLLEPLMIGYFAWKWLPQVPKQALWILAIQIVLALIPVSIVFFLGL